MKVVLATHQFLPDFSGGTEILTFRTAKELLRRGHQVCVVTGHPSRERLPDDRRLQRSSHGGIEVRRFHWDFTGSATQPDVFQSEYDNALFGALFRDYLADAQPDVVHFLHLYRLSGSAIDACTSLNIPTIYTATDFWFVCPTADLRLPGAAMCEGPRADRVNCVRHLFGANRASDLGGTLARLPDEAVARLVRSIQEDSQSARVIDQRVRAIAARPSHLMDRLNSVGRVIVPSKVTERVLINNGLRRQRVRYSRFGIDLAPFINRSKQPSVDGRLRLGFVGRIAPQKGLCVLLQAMRGVPARLPITLDVWGDDRADRRYSQEVRAIAGHDARIRFRGLFAQDEIGDVFSNLDVIIVPSLCAENTPLVVYEAQAARCPVIASDVEGIAELIQPEHNGMLFKMGNVSQLATCIQRVAEDKQLLASLAVNSMRPKSMVEYADELLGLYTEVQRSSASQTS
jgi:glycosyltransferase involved in cell wall biosynthesis